MENVDYVEIPGMDHVTTKVAGNISQITFHLHIQKVP